jgi:intracellular sulfur oxidation DsrE/DsrF family protein
MPYKLFILCLCLFAGTATHAQQAASKRDEILLAKFKAKGTYPLIKASKLSGVMPVNGVNDMADSNATYKLVFGFTTGTADPQKIKEPNRGLAEIGRIINLHIAAGIPVQNLQVVIVTHRKALYSLYTNEAFKKEFKADNPNLELIHELEAAGVKFVACGQAMQFLDIDRQNLLPEVKTALAAMVALSTYQQKGYVLYDIGEE